METNYVGKKFFNFGAFQMLNDKIKNEPDDAEIIEDAIKSFTAYVQDVNVGEQQIRTAYATLDGDSVRQRVQAIDSRRRTFHENAIISANVLNRLAAVYGLSNIFTGDSKDRLQVADFCLDVTVTLFENRKR